MELLKNYLLDTSDEDANIYETSFVEEPATGFDFLKFNKEDVKTLEFKRIETAEFKRMVSGVWFMPDTKYLRMDASRGLYTVEFKREALKEALIKYLKSDYANNTKVEHQGQFLEGFVSIEHWIYDEDSKKSPVFGHSIQDLGYSEDQVRYGTVFKTVYVQDEQFWNDEIMTGKVKGFSLGGLFTLEEEKTYGMETFSEVAVEQPAEVVTDVLTQDVLDEVGGEPLPKSSDEGENTQGLVIETETTDSVETIEPSQTSTPDTTNNPSNDNSLLDMINLLKQEIQSIKQSLNDKDAQNASLSSELQTILEKQKSVEQENETLKTQVKSSPIPKTSFNPSVKVNSTPDTAGKQLIGGYWV